MGRQGSFTSWTEIYSTEVLPCGIHVAIDFVLPQHLNLPLNIFPRLRKCTYSINSSLPLIKPLDLFPAHFKLGSQYRGLRPLPDML